MSSTVRTPCRRAWSSASVAMRWVCSVERWVPVTARARLPRDEALVDVPLLDGHVGAVLAVEDEGEGLPVLDAEQHEPGEPPRVGRDVAHVAALGRQGSRSGTGPCGRRRRATASPRAGRAGRSRRRRWPRTRRGTSRSWMRPPAGRRAAPRTGPRPAGPGRRRRGCGALWSAAEDSGERSWPPPCRGDVTGTRSRRPEPFQGPAGGEARFHRGHRPMPARKSRLRRALSPGLPIPGSTSCSTTIQPR